MNYKKMSDDSEPRAWSILDYLEEDIIERLLDESYNEKEQEYLDEYYERKNN
jgi:hypothetical protein